MHQRDMIIRSADLPIDIDPPTASLSTTMEDRDSNYCDNGNDDSSIPDDEIALSTFIPAAASTYKAYTDEQLVDLTNLLLNEVRLRRDRVDPRVVHIRLPGDETRILARRSHVVFPYSVDLDQLKEERRASTDNLAGTER